MVSYAHNLTYKYDNVTGGLNYFMKSSILFLKSFLRAHFCAYFRANFWDHFKLWNSKSVLVIRFITFFVYSKSYIRIVFRYNSAQMLLKLCSLNRIAFKLHHVICPSTIRRVTYIRCVNYVFWSDFSQSLFEVPLLFLEVWFESNCLILNYNTVFSLSLSLNKFDLYHSLELATEEQTENTVSL